MQPIDDSFAAFYTLYPRHVARKAAEKAWMRVATSPEVIEQIMAGLRAQLPQMLKKDKEFVPHPSTWLNQRRFEDEAGSTPPRVIVCEKCGGTGAVAMCEGTNVSDTYDWKPGRSWFEPCTCPIGQLPGVLAGVVEEAL